MFVETEQNYILYKVKLNKYKDMKNKEEQQFKIKRVFSFDRSQFPGIVKDMHVRGGSDKHSHIQNYKTIAFVIIGNFLYHWTEGFDNLKLIKEVNCQIFESIEDECLMISCVEHNIFKVQKINVSFADFQIETIFEYKMNIYKVINYGYDEI